MRLFVLCKPMKSRDNEQPSRSFRITQRHKLQFGRVACSRSMCLTLNVECKVDCAGVNRPS